MKDRKTQDQHSTHRSSGDGGMSVREAGQKGGQKVRELIEKGKERSSKGH